MAIRKNKKRFDPRYFMDEKMEEPLNEGREERPAIRISVPKPPPPKKPKKRKDKQDKIYNNAGDFTSVDHSIDHSLEEGLENVTPENLAIVAQAAAIVAGNFAPAVILGALGMKLKEAVDFLWRESGKPGDPPNVDEKDLEESVGLAGSAVDQMRAQAAQQGSPKAAQEAARRLYSLVGTQQMHDALWTVRENFPSLGDVNRMKNDKLMGSEFASEELKNAIRILVLLGENLDKWCPDCDLKRQTEYVPEDPQDVAEPGQLQEKRRRLKKKRFK